MSWFRRQRPWAEIANDPQAPYMIGRLLGANEMASILLDQDGESANARHIAQVLRNVTLFFFENVQREPVKQSQLPG